MVDALNSTAFRFAEAPVSWAELLGFVTALACVWLTVRQRIANFPLGIASNVFFGVLFVEAALYADAALQVVYLGLAAFGWWAWLRLGPDRTELRVSEASPALLLGVLVGVVALTAVLVPVLDAAHGSRPFLDASTTSLSLGAQLLLNLKKIQTWYVWIAADLLYVPLYIDRELYLTALVYCVFLGLCVAGLVAWRRTASPVPA